MANGLMALMTVAAIAAISPPGVTEHSMYEAHWSETQREVWQTILKWNDAFEANDADSYFTFVDPDIVVIVPSSPYRVEGKPADRREYEFGLEKGMTRVGFFQELQPHVTVQGDMAVATYYSRGFYGVGDSGKIAILRETDVLVKRKDGWKLLHIHVSVPPK